MSLIELPYDFLGRVFRSEMPFSGYDPLRKLFLDYQKEQVSVIVLLAEDAEYRRITGFDLRNFYLEHGLEVIHLPIPDFGIPTIAGIKDAVELASLHASQGRNMVIHCHGGIGRTGMFAACLAIQKFGNTSEEAITWVRERIAGAVEVPAQVRIVELFAEGRSGSC